MSWLRTNRFLFTSVFGTATLVAKSDAELLLCLFVK